MGVFRKFRLERGRRGIFSRMNDLRLSSDYDIFLSGDRLYADLSIRQPVDSAVAEIRKAAIDISFDADTMIITALEV